MDARGYERNYGVHPMLDEEQKPSGVQLDFMTRGGNVGSRLYVREENEGCGMGLAAPHFNVMGWGELT